MRVWREFGFVYRQDEVMRARYALPGKLTPSIVRNFGCIAAREKAHRSRHSKERDGDANVFQNAMNGYGLDILSGV